MTDSIRAHVANSFVSAVLLASLFGCQPRAPAGVGQSCDDDESCGSDLRCIESVPEDDDGYVYPEVRGAVGTCQIPCESDADCYFRGRGDRREHCETRAEPAFCFLVWLM